MDYSVLMTVYWKETPENLQASIQSILDQTVKTNDFVLVCDGPLTERLETVLSQFQVKIGDYFRILRLEKNSGVGPARNIGLEACHNRYVAIMDSDDLAMPDRCELQLKAFQKNPDLAIVGGQMSEFIGRPENVIGIKRVPTEYTEICAYAKRRDPFNNITVMLDRIIALEAGGYPPLNRCEDYLLYVMILHEGYKCENLDRVIASNRLTNDTYCRRGSKENLKGFIEVRLKIHKLGFSSIIDFIIPVIAQCLYMIIPLPLKKLLYQKIIRKT